MIKQITIDSKHNPRLKELKKLQEKKHRVEQGKYLVEGFRLLEEAFKAGKKVFTVIYDKDKEENFNQYVLPYLTDEEIIVSTQEVLKDLTKTVNPQGVAGIISTEIGIEDVENALSQETSLFVYLDGLQDPGNLGTIMRSSHAAGASGILFGKNTVDPYGDKVIRSSMGSIFHVPLFLDGDRVLDELVRKGFKIAVTSLAAEKNLYHENLLGNIVVVIGNEGSGITKELEEKGDILLRIPMPGGAESLNAAVAASIVLFERVRQLEDSKGK